MDQKIAVIVGAGPAGLTAAYELVTRTDIKPIIFEADIQVGGIAKTVNYKGNRIDIGGHRFFSKSDRVMDWWTKILPIQAMPEGDADLTISYQNKQRQVNGAGQGPNPDLEDEVMLVRSRVSRIFYGRKMYDYPLKLSLQTFRNLGLARTIRIIFGYLWALARPITPEVTLRDFIINRFGRELYATFFERYTEKVWGIPCEDIPADWGAQRIKGVSIKALLMNVLRKLKPTRGDISQKDTETSLIERFLYPKLGPGQLWEVVARKVQEKGGELHMQARVVGVEHANGRITSVVVEQNGKKERIKADFLFSSMPLQGLIKGWSPAAPAPIRAVSDGLVYRDFLTVGLLLDEINIGQKSKAAELRENIPDNWVYIQDDDVKVGRLQIFNNWSPYLVADPDTIWMGLEYFVNEGDDLWSKPDDEMIAFGMAEMEKLGVAQGRDLRDAVVVRTKKAYPAYFGTYDQLDQLQDYAKTFDNLFCVGRNGMHRYNNQDHSMLTAMVAVDGLVEKRNVMDELWLINTEDEYHESK